MRTDRLPWLLVFGLLCSLIVMRAWGDVGFAKLAAERERADSLQAVADSLKDRAAKADTVLVHVMDTLKVVVERTREVARAATDSLYAMADSAEAVQLDALVEAHAEEVAALESLADANLTWGNTWRDYALALEQANNQLRISNTLAYGMLRSQRRTSTLYQAGTLIAAGALGAVVLLK